MDSLVAQEGAGRHVSCPTQDLWGSLPELEKIHRDGIGFRAELPFEPQSANRPLKSSLSSVV